MTQVIEKLEKDKTCDSMLHYLCNKLRIQSGKLYFMCGAGEAAEIRSYNHKEIECVVCIECFQRKECLVCQSCCWKT